MHEAAALPEPLVARLKGLRKFAIAYSGGLDSRFLVHAASLCGCDIILINAQGPHISPYETEWARRFAQGSGTRLESLVWNPLTLPAVAGNNADRCYHCKKGLLTAIRKKAAAVGYDIVCDGGNADDQHAYRPGLAAVRELGILSPLADLGKAEIRAVAGASGLSRPGQPASACLLTRFAYGLRPEPGMLAAVARCEHELAGLLTRHGFVDASLRLRLTPAPVVQVPVRALAIAAMIKHIAAAHGFAQAEIIGTEQTSGYFDKKRGD